MNTCFLGNHHSCILNFKRIHVFNKQEKTHVVKRFARKSLKSQTYLTPPKKPDGALVFSCKVINLLAMEK